MAITPQSADSISRRVLRNSRNHRSRDLWKSLFYCLPGGNRQRMRIKIVVWETVTCRRLPTVLMNDLVFQQAMEEGNHCRQYYRGNVNLFRKLILYFLFISVPFSVPKCFIRTKKNKF